MSGDEYELNQREMNAPNRQKAQRRSGGTKLRLWVLGVSGFVTLVGGLAFFSAWNSGTSASVQIQAEPLEAIPSAISVSIRNFQFDPPRLEVKKGETVEWRNIDVVPHTATSDTFDSGLIATSNLWRHTFQESGTFSYICSYHPQMKGVVIVK